MSDVVDLQAGLDERQLGQEAAEGRDAGERHGRDAEEHRQAGLEHPQPAGLGQFEASPSGCLTAPATRKSVDLARATWTRK